LRPPLPRWQSVAPEMLVDLGPRSLKQS
jgi:hypothetical protein